MNHYIIPTLLEDKPDIVIVHVGINDVLNRCDQDQMIKNIHQIYTTCKNFNVNKVIISSIVYCKKADNSVTYYINENLKVETTTEGYQFLDNGNIKLENLCRDGLRLGESGKNLLLDNYVNYFVSIFRFYRTVSNSSLNKNAKLSDINSRHQIILVKYGNLKK